MSVLYVVLSVKLRREPRWAGRHQTSPVTAVGRMDKPEVTRHIDDNQLRTNWTPGLVDVPPFS